MKTGFTLGKFAPLHKGHEYVVSTALREMDHVIVIIYNASEVTDIPTMVRANWIKEIFPSVEVIVAEDGPQETGYTQEIIVKQNNYLKTLIGNRKIAAFYSSENYGLFVSEAFNCENRIVDLNRDKFKIRSTEIRNRQYAKSMLSKCVYDCIKPKVYFLGGPSTGKTTISKYCSIHLDGAYCNEFGRDYWFNNQVNHRLSMKDLEIIAKEQNRLEEIKSKENQNYVFVDTTTLTTLAYSYYYFGFASKTLTGIVKDNLYKYKNLFLCSDDIPFDNTWDRSGPESRKELQKINIELLRNYRIPYTILSGSINDRYNTVKQRIEAFKLCGTY